MCSSDLPSRPDLIRPPTQVGGREPFWFPLPIVPGQSPWGCLAKARAHRCHSHKLWRRWVFSQRKEQHEMSSGRRHCRHQPASTPSTLASSPEGSSTRNRAGFFLASLKVDHKVTSRSEALPATDFSESVAESVAKPTSCSFYSF